MTIFSLSICDMIPIHRSCGVERTQIELSCFLALDMTAVAKIVNPWPTVDKPDTEQRWFLYPFVVTQWNRSLQYQQERRIKHSAYCVGQIQPLADQFELSTRCFNSKPLGRR